MLLERMKSRRVDIPVWIGPDGKILSAPEIEVLVTALRSRHAGLQGRKVVLRCNSDFLTARALLTLDGFCAELLLIHPGTPESDCAAVESGFGPDGVLTDADFAGDDSPPVPHVKGAAVPETVTKWMIPTSGTTRTPRLIPHDSASLSRTVKSPAAGLPHHWGLMYGITRFAGLQVFLQSLLGGGVLLFPPSGASFPEKVRYLSECGCTALSATPTHWRKILMTPLSERLRLQQITVGGEIVDQPLLDLVKSRFPEARVVHIYASTETGVGFTVKDGLSGFPCSWLADGIENVRMKIHDGTLWLKIPGRTLSPTCGIVEVDEEGYINTGDLVLVDSDRVRFLGRMNGTINVGGNKVSPEEVEQVLLAHPAVLLASAHGARNPISGQIVVAEVALKPGHHTVATEIEKELRFFCRERLDLYKVPARVTLVDDLTVNESGKITRRPQWTG
ncbi:ANL family adenylate-forming protein [Geomesophilobacter sediminis]|uniref:Long-chain fatty acid--CoA ligase n=1 Tax=Geomesophilobacter sediminis TaxID=2798584 RepID=A0A8J7M2J1_9BACT|nr:fatty acid--CoA ligase family protein [Geomesophilobacter sediminis]MBJ6727564.1 long-chain fatty acid--CoA ligase [Geomesophilobacter sediminis]